MPLILGVALGSVGATGYFDYITYPNISLALLYLFPIGLATWFASTIAGLAVAAAAVGAWLMGDLNAPQFDPELPLVPYWNAAMRAGVFAAFVCLLSALRNQRHWLDREVRERTLELHREIAERKRLAEQSAIDLAAQKQDIANELHDGLASFLTALSLQAKHLEEELQAVSSSHSTVAARMGALLEDAVDQTRSIARGLHCVRIEARQLVVALANLATDTQAIHHVQCRFTADCAMLPIDQEMSLHLYLIVQQAVDNAIRHGGARQVDIELQCVGGQFHVSVVDDGCGFDPGGGPFSGLGLRLMKFRAGVLGGQLSIVSSRGAGTRVEVLGSIPAAADTQEEGATA